MTTTTLPAPVPDYDPNDPPLDLYETPDGLLVWPNAADWAKAIALGSTPDGRRVCTLRWAHRAMGIWLFGWDGADDPVYQRIAQDVISALANDDSTGLLIVSNYTNGETYLQWHPPELIPALRRAVARDRERHIRDVARREELRRLLGEHD